jgi:hypothetical protein
MENSQSKENKMKKTAVDFLVEGINKLTGLNIAMDEPIIEQAKEKEKEKIIDAYNQGCLDTLKDGMKRGEQYYNETFKK